MLSPQMRVFNRFKIVRSLDFVAMVAVGKVNFNTFVKGKVCHGL